MVIVVDVDRLPPVANFGRGQCFVGWSQSRAARAILATCVVGESDHRRRLQLVGRVLVEKRLVYFCRHRFDGAAGDVYWSKIYLEKIAGRNIHRKQQLTLKQQLNFWRS